MATRSSNTSVWVILSVGVTIIFGVFGFIWSIIQGQVNDLKSEFVKYQADSRWAYASKDFVNGKIDGIQTEEATYRKYVADKKCP